MPEVSIIIPTFNRSNFLKKTLDSILEQSYSNYEVLVISNGSTDDSEIVVASFQDPRIKFVYQEGSGSPASPRNHGIRLASGKYIAFCDDDDLWLKEKLEKQITFLRNNPKCGICYTKMKRFDEKKEWVNVAEETDHMVDCKLLLLKNVIPLSSVVIKKDDLANFEWFDEDKTIAGAEDYEFLLRLSKKTDLFCIPEYLVLYYSGGGRFSDSTASSFFIKNIKYIVRLYHVYEKIVKKKYFKWHEVFIPFFRNFFNVLKIILYHLKKKFIKCIYY